MWVEKGRAFPVLTIQGMPHWAERWLSPRRQSASRRDAFFSLDPFRGRRGPDDHRRRGAYANRDPTHDHLPSAGRDRFVDPAVAGIMVRLGRNYLRRRDRRFALLLGSEHIEATRSTETFSGNSVSLFGVTPQPGLSDRA